MRKILSLSVYHRRLGDLIDVVQHRKDIHPDMKRALVKATEELRTGLQLVINCEQQASSANRKWLPE